MSALQEVEVRETSVRSARQEAVTPGGIDVSVLMPVRNPGPFLAEAVESVLGQTGVGFELICVDDGSGDGSWETLSRFAARDSRMRAERVRAALATSSPLIHPTVMMRREALLRVGGYRKLFDAAEDYELWLRLASIVELDNLPDPLLLYRRHPGSTTAWQPLRQARGA